MTPSKMRILRTLLEREQFEFIRLKENSEKFKYAESLLTKHEIFFKYGLESCEMKDNERSLQCCIKGTHLYQQQRFEDAIEVYNKGLTLALTIENFSFIYAHRAIVFFEMGRYDDCRENVIWVKNYNYNCLPEDIRLKLNDLEKECENKKNIKALNFNLLLEIRSNVKSNPHPQIPFITDRVGIKRDYSRYILYAKEYIEAGTLVINEPFINKVLVIPAKYTHCYYCLKACLNLIACPNCTCAMFCNEECMILANEEFHKWECPIMDLIYYADDHDHVTWLSFRLILKMINIFGDYARLKEYWMENGRRRNCWFSFEAENFNDVSYLQAFHSLLSSCQPNIDSFYLLNAVVCAFFTRECLKYSPKLKEFFKGEEEKNLFGEIFLNHMIIYSKIYFTINLKRNHRFSHKLVNVGSIIQELTQVPHSPNIIQRFWDSKLFSITTRPILKGELLTFMRESN